VNLIKKYSQELILIFILSLIYFAIRIPNLTYQPIFADEAIYVRWAQVMRAEPTLRFLPLSDGKTPLFMWGMIPLFKIFEDPLIAGRILSVFAGFGTMLGVLALGWLFFNRKVGLWGAFLVVFTPYFFFFDRMALVDSMLSAFTIWGVFLALLLIKYPRFDLAMLLGYVMGAGFLTKTPAMFNIVTMPAAILTFNFRDKLREKKIIRIFLLWLLTIAITIGVYNILRLGPGFANLNSRNQDYVLDPMTLLIRPWDPFLPHFNDLKDWFPRLLGLPLLAAIIYGAFLAVFKRNRVALAILVMSLIPLGVQMALLKTFTARYILFTMPGLIVIGAFGLSHILDKINEFVATQIKEVALLRKIKFSKIYVTILTAVVIVAWPFYYIFLLHTNIQNAPIPKNERQGYLEEWTAGYGLKELAQYLDELSKKDFLVVGTEGSFGTLPDGLQIYLDKNRQIAIIGGGATVSAQVRNAAREHPTYFVANRAKYTHEQPYLELIKEYPKARNKDGKQDAILLFKVNPTNDDTNASQ
jgi:4-amino-4-deoxy-L-arabinose transferase-like glycosyltransferase